MAGSVRSNLASEARDTIILSRLPLFYSCGKCSFFLHKSCVELSRKKQHPLHQHPLTPLSNLIASLRGDTIILSRIKFVWTFDLPKKCGQCYLSLDNIVHTFWKLVLTHLSLPRKCRQFHLTGAMSPWSYPPLVGKLPTITKGATPGDLAKGEMSVWPITS